MKAEPPSQSLSRRDALRQTLLATLGLSAIPASAATETSPEIIFVPENDYPLFGSEESGDDRP